MQLIQVFIHQGTIITVSTMMYAIKYDAYSSLESNMYYYPYEIIHTLACTRLFGIS